MSYYEHFRSAPPSRGTLHGLAAAKAIVIHLSLLSACIHPLGAVVGPTMGMLLFGERDRDVESEAMEVLNFGFLVSALAIALRALDRAFWSVYEAGLPDWVWVVAIATLTTYVWRAIRAIRRGRLHDYRPTIALIGYPTPGSKGARLAEDVRAARAAKAERKK